MEITGNQGSVILLSLFLLILTAMIITTMTRIIYDQVGIETYYENRVKVLYLAESGVEHLFYLIQQSPEEDGQIQKITGDLGGEGYYQVNLISPPGPENQNYVFSAVGSRSGLSRSLTVKVAIGQSGQPVITGWQE